MLDMLGFSVFLHVSPIDFNTAVTTVMTHPSLLGSLNKSLMKRFPPKNPQSSWEGYLWEQHDPVWPIRFHASSKFCCG